MNTKSYSLMKVEEAQQKLALERKKAKEARIAIDKLRKIVIDLGGNPDPWRVDYIPRNKQMYKMWKDGYSFKEIGKEYRRSGGMVNQICRRIDKILENKKSVRYNDYKDLLPYR